MFSILRSINGRLLVSGLLLAPLLVVVGLGSSLAVEDQSSSKKRVRQPTTSTSTPVRPGRAMVKPLLSAAERQSILALHKTLPRLAQVALDLSRPDHRAFFLAHRKAAGTTPEKNPELTDFLQKADAYYAAHGKPKSGFVYLVNGKTVDDTGAATDGPAGPIVSITSFQRLIKAGNYGVSGIVTLPSQPSTCTQTLQVFDEAGNPQGPADVNTQTLACENAQLYAEGQLDPTDKYATAQLMTHGIMQNGTPFVYTATAFGSAIPTKIVSTNPNDLNGDGMIKFCFGRTATDCDYSPSGSSQSNVYLPINGNTTWNSALLNPATDPKASVRITITQPQPQAGGGCDLVANVSTFMQTVTLSNNNMTVNWNDQSVHFPAINSACMPNGSIVYYNMQMDVDLASNVPTFFGISSSPNTPISTGFYLMLAPTRVYYSCLAADAQVALADGSSKAIADIREGDRVMGGPDGKPLNVSVIYTGTENKPLVHIMTGNGFDLKLTQGHPVITSEGVRLARFLKVGDVLQTSKGPSPIEAVDRVDYDGKVYNLSLAAMQSEEKLDADQETFFGNGILVGGNEMQWRYDRPEAQVVATALPPPVPHMSETARALLAKRFGPQAHAQ